MARCQCGGGDCQCVVQAGSNATVTGSGSSTAPFTVSAVTNCEEVRQCLSGSAGVAYDSGTGVIAVDVSEDAGNNLVLRGNGLYVPTGSATVVTGCGLVGDGSASAPVQASTQTWPYACDVTAQAGGVYCDADGVLRSDPPARANYYEAVFSQTFTNVAVPTTEQVVIGYTLTLQNPDPCRAAMAMVWQDVDVQMNLPANSGAMYGINTDDMWYGANRGTTGITGTHAQVGRLVRTTVPAGGTTNFLLNVTMGRGSGGANYSHIQSTQRGWVFSMPN